VGKKKIRLMLVDDHPLVRRGLAELISDEPHLEVCAQVASAEDALQEIDRVNPDLVIVDVTLPGMNGVELIKRLRSRYPGIMMLVASMHDESLFAERCLRAGANGYVNKEEATDKVVDAINRVIDGHVYLSAEMTNRLLHGVIAGDVGQQSALESLTDRELEVFALIGRGLPTREIAHKLHLSVKTIETHRDHVRAKLKIGSTNELMRHAVQWVLENG
jgi:DNA-binding NarL/FixJ family response regulator